MILLSNCLLNIYDCLYSYICAALTIVQRNSLLQWVEININSLPFKALRLKDQEWWTLNGTFSFQNPGNIERRKWKESINQRMGRSAMGCCPLGKTSCCTQELTAIVVTCTKSVEGQARSNLSTGEVTSTQLPIAIGRLWPLGEGILLFLVG